MIKKSYLQLFGHLISLNSDRDIIGRPRDVMETEAGIPAALLTTWVIGDKSPHLLGPPSFHLKIGGYIFSLRDKLKST
jgi:hypothetical protein